MILTSRQRRRKGTLTNEAIMAIALAVTLLAGLAQFLAVTVVQRRVREQRVCAQREAGNLMERLMSRSWSNLTPELASETKLSRIGQATLKDGQVQIRLREEQQPMPAKRIEIRIDWQTGTGARAVPVTLVAWKYAREGTP